MFIPIMGDRGTWESLAHIIPFGTTECLAQVSYDCEKLMHGMEVHALPYRAVTVTVTVTMSEYFHWLSSIYDLTL